MSYLEFTQLINENRKKIASIKSRSQGDPQLKINAYKQINSILHQQNLLIMERHQVLKRRAVSISEHYTQREKN